MSQIFIPGSGGGGGGGGISTITGNTGGAESPDGSSNFNIVGAGSITIAGSLNTETVQLTGLTANNVLIGQGTTTIGLAAPSATSGVPLISQGAASAPIFGTAVVAGGGTGDTSFTAYSVITGGTTSTGALQNVSGVGTSGQVLTSNGAGALPTWQAAASGGVTSVSGTANRITSTGGTTPVIDISAAYVGQTSITTLGTIATGTWQGTAVDLAHGGTNANLTASNGGIFYSTASAGAILSGTATANKVLMSGSSTAPVWSTPTYPNASATSGKIIISDGTNFISSTPTYPNSATTGDIIYASGSNAYSDLAIGATAGQFLTSNGSTPFWFVNTQDILMRDDFFGNGSGNSDVGFNIGGGGSGGGNKPDTTYGTSAHPGVWSVFSNGSFANWSLNTGIVFYFGGGAIIADFVAKIPTLSNATNRVDFYIGFTDNNPPGTTANAYFHYRDNLNSGNWVLITTATGSTTTVNTSTAVDTNWHRYTITVNAAATLVTFYIDGVSVGTSSTNIPTAGGSSGMTASFQSVNNGASDGTQMLIVADLFSFYQALTTAR